jgi:aminocarboxymuconate-semialdehyde decarboxylase
MEVKLNIDIHAHIVTRDYVDRLAKKFRLSPTKTDTGQVLLRQGSTTFTWYREDMFDEDARLRQMDDQGIAMRVLSLSSPGVYDFPRDEQVELARLVNDETARVIRRNPDRFQGLATLPLGDVAASIAELRRALDDLGMSGIAIGTHVAGKPLDHPDFEPFWREVNSRRAPVFEHPMLPLGAEHMTDYELPIRVGFVYETTTAITRMIYGGIFERYPDFPFITAHTGGAALALMERLDNGYRLFPDCRRYISQLPSVYIKRLYFDTCSFFAPVIMMARDIVGSDRLLFGSDYPFISADARHVESLAISAEEKAAILGGNAKRLLSIG